MSVRRGKYRDRKSGEMREHWLVDVTFVHADNREERIRKVSPVQTRRGAEQYERDLRERLLLGERRKEAVEVPTLARFAKTFLETHAEANNKPSEVHTKERVLRCHLVPALGRLRLDQLGVEHVEGYKAAKRKTHSDKTVNNHLAVLRTMLSVAEERGVIEKAPRVTSLKTGSPDIRWLTGDELETFLAAAGEWRTMFLVGARVGLRMGELRALRWCDVDLRAAQLTVNQAAWLDKIGTPKGGRSRVIPLCEEVRTALAAAPRPILGGLVWPGEDGKLRETDACQWGMSLAVKASGLEDVGWHTLRHTFASHLVQRGVDLHRVQRLLGHADIRTTMRYAHLAPGALADAVRVFDVLPGGKLTANQTASEAAV
jgi:integrase